MIAQAGSSDRGRDFAARWSELIFTPQPVLKAAQDFYDDIKSRASDQGRDPNDIKVLPGAFIIVGENEAIAREKGRALDEPHRPARVAQHAVLDARARSVRRPGDA